ncbi:MAG TPA: hypothetical protein ENL34_13525 [Chloroflexi bacterium]|nr:hypothetical protein [Chloroflexota bacterium]
MIPDTRSCFVKRGQSTVELALLVALIAIVAMISLLLLGPRLNEAYQAVVAALSGGTTEPTTSPVVTITQDFLARMRDYYNTHGRWPRSWGSYRFTDIGLDPADWSGPIEGIYWNPRGNAIGLANRRGDNLQVYVRAKNGNLLKLYDGWDIWCLATDGTCYYHTIAPGNEVDISTLMVLEVEP